MPTDDIGWVLWSATVGLDRPIAARIEAAIAAGFTRVSMSAEDVARAEEEGTPRQDLSRALRDAGLDVVIDPVMGWYGGPALTGGFGSIGVDDVLRMSEALPVVAMTAIGPFTPDEVPTNEIPERFAGFCDRAAAVGAVVQLEFMPFTAVTDLATAWRLVEDAGRPNGGVLFDTWHFFRGAADFEVLGRVPGERILGVQISDAPVEVRGNLGEDTFHRLLPGDGSFDLLGAVRALDAIGALRWVGPEVLSPSTAAMPAAEAARLAGDRVRDLIAQARS